MFIYLFYFSSIIEIIFPPTFDFQVEKQKLQNKRSEKFKTEQTYLWQFGISDNACLVFFISIWT